MSYFTGSDSWRVAFLLLTRAEQKTRVRELARRGWSPGSISKLAGWPIEQVMRAIREKPVSNTTTTGEHT